MISSEKEWQVYQAIDDAQAALGVAHEPLIEEENLAHYLGKVLAAGSVTRTDLPAFVVDIPDGVDLYGCYLLSENEIHLQRSKANRWNIIHEIAHWALPNNDDPHNPEWRACCLALLRTSVGDAAADALADAFDDRIQPEPGSVQLRPASDFIQLLKDDITET